jgi:DNA-directed RNA polymerase subunit alpha
MLHSNYSKLVKPTKMDTFVSDDGFNGKFVLYPIQKGFGVTLGNTLRRVLLSSMRGSVISVVKIEGVNNEFSSIS